MFWRTALGPRLFFRPHRWPIVWEGGPNAELPASRFANKVFGALWLVLANCYALLLMADLCVSLYLAGVHSCGPLYSCTSSQAQVAGGRAIFYVFHFGVRR